MCSDIEHWPHPPLHLSAEHVVQEVLRHSPVPLTLAATTIDLQVDQDVHPVISWMRSRDIACSACTPVCTCTHCVHTHIHMYVHMHKNMFTSIYTHTYIHRYILLQIFGTMSGVPSGAAPLTPPPPVDPCDGCVVAQMIDASNELLTELLSQNEVLHNEVRELKTWRAQTEAKILSFERFMGDFHHFVQLLWNMFEPLIRMSVRASVRNSSPV